MRDRPSRRVRSGIRGLLLFPLVAALVAVGAVPAYAAVEDTEPPSTPGPITVAEITETSVLLTWAASVDNVGVAWYDMAQQSATSDAIALRRVSTNSILITSGLSPSRTYTFYVNAWDDAGNRSASSPRLRLTMPPGDDQPPTVPTGLTTGSIGETAVSLSWGTATDNVVLLGYEVLSITSTGDTVVARTSIMPPVFPTPATSVSVSGLTAGTTYTFAVRAFDEAGNLSALSAPVTVTTLPPPVSCAVSYSLNQWTGGMATTLMVRNTGTAAINGWTLSWTFLASQHLISLSGAELVRRDGDTIIVRNASYNPTIQPGATVYVGYVASGSWVPTSFVLNGVTCNR